MAGTTGAVLYLKPTTSGLLSVDGKSSAVVYFPLRLASGVFGSGAQVTTSDNDLSLKAWLPSSRTPVSGADGRMTPEWYRFFDYLVNQKLGGPEAPTVADVTSSVTDVQQAVTQQVGVVAAVSQQVNQNAQVTAAQTEVLKVNAVPGAAQIPTVQYSPYEFDSRGGE